MPTNGCRVLQVTDVIFDPAARRVRGAMGGCVYPSWKDAVYVMTNEVRNAVAEASGNAAMVVPFRSHGTYGEEQYWWKPTPESKGELELIVRVYKNQGGQVFIGICLHTRGDDIAVKFAEPQTEQRSHIVSKKQLPPVRGNGTLSAMKNNAENANRRPPQGAKEEP